MANAFDQFDVPAANPFDKFDEPAKPSGMIRKIADKGLGFVSGAVGATKAITDAAGAGNAVSGALGSANEVVNDYLSPEAKADQQEQSAIMDSAKGQGVWEGVKAGARAFGVAPVQTAVQGLGSIVPVIAGGLAGLPGAVATGVAMGAGTAKGAIYDEIKKRGGTEEEAIQAQAYDGKNTDQIALGGALGAADAMTGVSRIAGGMVRNALGKPVKEAVTTGVERGVLGRAGMGMLGEMPLEAAQGGQEQVAANVAAQRAGYQAGTWDNVASNATLEALASAGPGAAFGAFEKHSSPAVPPAPPVEPTPPVEPSGLSLAPINDQTGPFKPDDLEQSSSMASVQKTFDPRDPNSRPPLGLMPMDSPDGIDFAQDQTFIDPVTGLETTFFDGGMERTYPIAPPKPSEAMGLAPTAAPSLTNAAIVAVDTGVYQPATSAFDQREADKPKAQEGDIFTTGSGALLTNRIMASKAAEKKSSESGHPWQPIELGAKKFAIRSSVQNDTSTTPAGVDQPAAATSSDKPIGGGMPAVGPVPAASGNAGDTGTTGTPTVTSDPVLDAGAGSDSVELTVTSDTAPAQENTANKPVAKVKQAQEAIESVANQRQSRIETTLNNGGHVVGNDLRMSNGMMQMKLTDDELLTIPDEKKRAKPNPDDARIQPANTPAATTGAPMGVTPSPSAGIRATQPTKSDQAKADVEHLFGLPEKRAKAIERIAKGTAYFSMPLKAQEFIAKNGLKETHQSVKTARGWDIVAKPGVVKDSRLPPTDIKTGDQIKSKGNDYTVTGPIDGGISAERTVKQSNGVTETETIFLKGDEAIQAKLDSQPTENTSAQTTKALEVQAKQPEAPAAGVAPKKDEGTWMATGRADFSSGKPRVLPSYFTKPGDKNSKDWYRGWDAANADIPVRNMQTANAKPEIVVDNAEMRPYRKPDGSVGYEAVPIQAETPAQDYGNTANAETMDLRKLAHVTEKPGDVMLGNDKFVTEAQAMAAAKAEMTETEWGMPFQFNRVLDIAPQDWNRMVLLMTGKEYGSDEKNKPVATGQGKAKIPTGPAAKPDTLSDKEKAAKAKMFNALGKLAALAGKNTRMNWTPEEEQQLLPIVIELFDGAMELGSVTFQKAVRYVREFIGNNLDQATADAIPFETLQGAYIHTARKYKDQGATTGKEVMSFDSLEELDKSAEKADIETKDTTNDSGTEKQGGSALDGVPSAEMGGSGGTGSGGRGARSGSTSRRKGNSSTDGERGTSGRSGGNGSADADTVATGGAGRGRGIKGNGSGIPADSGATDVKLAKGSKRGAREGSPGLFTESGEVVPAAVPAANFTITPDLKLGSGGEVTKYKDNIAAIRALKLIESEHRRATADEQRVLARYVGWGGLANAFRNRVTGAVKADWTNEVAELESLLTAKELKAASASTPNAHYTSETVTGFMWRAAKRLGFNGGMVLEPSVGSGNFIGMMPEYMRQGSYVTGIELDSITARIASALYPQANIVASGFEKLPLPDGVFDLAIGNPPFGKDQLRFQYNPKLNGKTIHNQFFLGSMDAVKPEGLQVMVVSRYLMDAQEKGARETLAMQAELLGAIRLPGSAFKGNAGTDVVTDILFLKKRTSEDHAALKFAMNERGAKVPAKEPYADTQARMARAAKLNEALAWTETAKVPDPLGGEPMVISQYFAKNPKMVAGVMDRSGSMQFGGDIDVKLPASELAAKLDGMMELLPSIDAVSVSEEIDQRTQAMHKALGESLSIMASGREIGSIYYDESGALTEIVERVGVDGKTIVSKNTIDANTPWSAQLSMNMEGKWFKEIAQLDEKGAKVKVGVKINPKTGKPTLGRNVYVREVFANESDIPNGLRLGADGFAKLQKLVAIRELYVEQISLETNSAASEKMEGNRAKLRAAYEAFVAAHGYISEQKNSTIISEMPDEGLMLSLELKFRPAVTLAAAVKRGIKPSAARSEQNAILTRAVAIPPERKNNAASVSDAVAIVLGESGRIDVARVAELRKITEEEALTELTGGDSPMAYLDPETNEVTEKNQYLSGNVRKKLIAAQDTGMKRNVEALMKVQPEPWTSDKVTAHMGASWVPPSTYADFVQALLGRNATVTFSKISNTFEVHAPGSSAVDVSRWGTGRYPAVQLLNDILNSRRIAVYDGGGKDDPRVLNETETQSAIDKKKEIIEEFDNWIFKDGDRRQELVKLFNDLYNTRVNRQYDGSHMDFPGKVPDSIIAFRRNQINAIWRGIVDRFTMYDHAVGAGKTFTGISRAMERKRMGLSNKPTIVVPNHLVSEWSTQAYRLYPGAKILAAGVKDLEPKNRRRLFAKIAAGDWDLVIVPHSSFKFIGISPETEERFINDELRVAQDALKEAEDDAEPGQRFKPLSVKAAEALILKLENRMDVVRGKAGKDQLLTFEQMGIDDLTIDESHEFKNLTYSTKLTDVRGLGPAAGSQKAFDLYTKMRILHETNGSAVFLTGTPISNSAVEMYTIMRYLAPEVLRENGLEHFDAFRAQFVQASEKPEPTEAGDGLKVVNRLGRNWSNMRSLMDGYYSVADVVTNDDIKAWYAEDNPGKVFPLPNVKGGGRRTVVAKPTPTQQLLIDELIAGYNGLPNIEDVKERNIARLRLMDKARKLALHAKVWDRALTDEPGGKLDKVVDESFRLYKAFEADKGAQLIFLDRSVPKAQGDDKQIKEYDALRAKLTEANANGDEAGQREAIEAMEKFDPQEIDELRAAQAGGWNAYQHMADGLIAKGVPKEQIAFIQNFTTDAQKKALFEAVNDGTIRFLFGSSQRMGAGMNVQERLVGLHHVDVTWKPSDIEQREGRIIRQGNLLLEKYGQTFEVEIMAYVTERSIDAKMWDLNSTKLRMVNGIRYYDGEFEMDFDDDAAIDMAEIAAIASGDPLMLERIKINTVIEELYRRRRSYNRRVESAGDSLRRAERDVEKLPGEIAKAKALMVPTKKAMEDAQSDQWKRKITIGEKTFTSLAPALAHAEESIKILKEGDSKKPFILDVDGENYSSEAGVQDAIAEKLGDVNPFVAEIAGQKVIRRTALARELRRVIGNEFTEIPSTPIGTLFGFPLTAKTEKGMFGSNVYLTAKVPYEGGIESVTTYYDLTPEKHKKGTQVPVLTSTLRAAVESLVTKLDNMGSDTYAIDRMQRNLKDATSNIPTYREAAKEQFKQADELDAALTRLDDIQDQLQARAAAASAAPSAPSDQISPALGDNPDNSGIPLAKTTFADGQEAAKWIADHDSRVFLKTLMQKIAPYLTNTSVDVLQPGGKVVGNLSQAEKSAIAAALPGNVKGINYDQSSTGKQFVFLRSDRGADHETLSHELTHAATVQALSDPARAAKFVKLAQQVRYALASPPKGVLLTQAEKEAHEFFKGQFRDVREFVAYALSSPTFQSIMKRMASDGRWMSDYRAPDALAKVQREVGPKRVPIPPVPTYSMWNRFVDAIRSLLGLPITNRKEYESLLSARTAAIENNAAAGQVEFIPLSEEISLLFDELLANSKNGSGIAVYPSNTSAQIQHPIGLITPSVSGLSGTLSSAANNVKSVKLPADYLVGDFFNSAPGKLGWWHKSIGTQYHLAQKSKPFKRVFDSVQNFLNDVSYYATEAADLAPSILPKLETWKDIAKSPISATDTKAFSAPVFEGTLNWARDESGKAVKQEVIEAAAAKLTVDQKSQRLLRGKHITEQVLRMWRGLPVDQYESLIESKFERDMMKAGIVFTDAELKQHFSLTPDQIKLYREFRKATDKSLTNLAIADMLRFGGKDVEPIRETVLASKDVTEAANTLADYLRSLSELEPDRADVLIDSSNKMIDKGNKAQDLMSRGYAPLSRFGQYTLDVVGQDGERLYFGMFESKWEAAKMARTMKADHPAASITQGTVSEQAYKLFAGVSPETLALFGDMLGLEEQGDSASAQAFQEYLKLATSNRSAMKRLIQRKGIAGFNEDAGRVLAGFVYSNARQTSNSLHAGEMTNSVNDMPKQQGELKDAAVNLVDYIKNPQEEAQAIRGLLFTQYIGGSIASAMVNLTQPLTMTMPWLSQYGGAVSAAKTMTAAVKDAYKAITGDAKLDAAIKLAEEKGIVSPQEVHQLMKQAQGQAALRSGDGTKLGNAAATAQNTLSRFMMAWGKPFSWAEQMNRRVTFIAAYRTAIAQKMGDPMAFAEKAIEETQGIYNKANKPTWARGALGGTLFTFKQYSIAYVEMLQRMSKNGPEGKKAALLALAVLFLLSGASGMPGADDLDDIISGALQSMGYNFDSKQKRKEFFVSLLGEDGARFMERGVSGLPGVPIDVAGRMGLGNLIPGTGLFQKKPDHTRDIAEIAGPAGDMVKRGYDAAGKLLKGEVLGAHGAIATAAPKAMQNLSQAFDMASMGMYRDQNGKKVLDTGAGDALVKALGFQPNDVARVQGASFDVQRMIGINKMRETEIADEWAKGLFEKDPDRVKSAREELAQWNRDNPESPIRIKFPQIMQRVKTMNQTKAERIAKTAPKEIRSAVKKELSLQ